MDPVQHTVHARSSIDTLFVPGLSGLVLVLVLVTGALIRNMQWISATDLLLDTCSKSPKKSRPFNSLGKLYADRGQYDLAIANFTIAIQNGTNLQDVHYYNLGLAYEKKGAHRDAAGAFQRALGINPAYPDAWYQLSVAQRNAGMFGDAKRALSQAISLDPGRPGPYNDLGGIYLVAKQYPEAKEAFRQALRIKPDYPEALYNLALAHDSAGEAGEAVGFYEQFLKVTPEDFPGKQEARERIRKLSKRVDGGSSSHR